MKIAKPFVHIVLPVLVVASIVIYVGNNGAQALNTNPATPPPGSSLDQRIAQRKAEQNVQLDKKAQTHLQQQCANAQSVLRARQAKTVQMISNRNATYLKIDAILWVNIGQLKLATQPTFNLEQQRAALAQKMADFATTAANYQQALDDILVMNCSADIIGFRALVDTARVYNTQLDAQVHDIFNYTTNKIKPTLTSFSATLQKNTNTTGTQ